MRVYTLSSCLGACALFMPTLTYGFSNTNGFVSRQVFSKGLVSEQRSSVSYSNNRKSLSMSTAVAVDDLVPEKKSLWQKVRAHSIILRSSS